MRTEKASFEVSAMARVLEVTRQGYYAYVKRLPSPRVQADSALCREAKQVFEEFESRYGSPRVHRELRKRGHRVGKRRVERALRGMGLSAARPRKRYRASVRDLTDPVAPNLLARDFEAQRPDERWVTDITYVWTQAGWVYLAAILDLFSRAVVGWAVDTSLTTRLPLRALEAAVVRRRPGEGLLHHSDRGCQYTAC
jgi:putative transposase